MTIAAPPTMEEIHSVFSFGFSVQVVHNYSRLKDHTCKGHNSKDTEHLQEIYNTFFSSSFFLGGEGLELCRCYLLRISGMPCETYRRRSLPLFCSLISMTSVQLRHFPLLNHPRLLFGNNILLTVSSGPDVKICMNNKFTVRVDSQNLVSPSLFPIKTT